MAQKIRSDQVGTGAVIQVATAFSSTASTTTTNLPRDDTIPQNTEGAQVLTVTITPKSATSRLLIEAKILVSAASAADTQGGLFQDSTANAIAGDIVTIGSSGWTAPIIIKHEMVAGSTASTTFKVRIGPSAGQTLTFNGEGGTRKLGGVPLSILKVTEIAG